MDCTDERCDCEDGRAACKWEDDDIDLAKFGGSRDDSSCCCGWGLVDDWSIWIEDGEVEVMLLGIWVNNPKGE